MKTRHFQICAWLILAALAATVLAYPQLPASLPTHWNWHGNVDNYGPRWVLFILGPGLMAAVLGLFAALPKISPQRFELATPKATYHYLMLVVVAMIGCLYAIMLWAAWSGSANLPQAMLVVVAVFFALIGNVMGKVRRNFWIGIRTPWTLASERVWYATHRLAGKTIVIAASVCLFAIFAGLPFWLCLAILIIGPCLPAVYSLAYYQRLKASGGLE